ncbi:MAG: hypothetical protein PWP27_333 [Clostridiales bacterium]|jgi:hypothetical protein|nr:hypothetical protein [Clostridiales bacterium]MDK2932523.1 hypothetical protein [Clostridiales bacterium]
MCGTSLDVYISENFVWKSLVKDFVVFMQDFLIQ